MPDFEPQKVLHLRLEQAKKKPKLDRLYLITAKLDGWYGFIDYHPSSGWGYPRNENRVIPSWMFTKEWFEKHIPIPHEATRFIFEAVIHDTPFHILNGIFNRKSEDAKDIQFILHDVLKLDSFFIESRKENLAGERYKLLQAIGLPYHTEDKYRISVSPLLAATKHESIWKDCFENVVEEGGEGIVLKAEDGLYTPGKRNSDLLKWKLEETFDLLVIDMFWTTGEKGNPNLNLKLQNKDGVEVPVRVPKDKDILHFTTKDNPIGSVATIKCMKKLEDGSYREPRFSHIRYDKQTHEID